MALLKLQHPLSDDVRNYIPQGSPHSLELCEVLLLHRPVLHDGLNTLLHNGTVLNLYMAAQLNFGEAIFASIDHL